MKQAYLKITKVQKLETKMDNQGFTRQQSKKDKNQQKDSISYRSECQTTYNQEENDRSLLDIDISNQSIIICDRQTRIQLELNKNQKSKTKKYQKEQERKQLQRLNFISISKTYQDIIFQKYQHKGQRTTLNNFRLKYYKRNQQNRTKKLEIIRKLCGTQNQKRFLQIKKLIQCQQLSLQKNEQLEIRFYKCQCNFVTTLKRSLLTHLRRKPHKQYFSIQSLKQRKKQQKFYDDLFMYGQIDLFSSSWLYKSFQLIFVQGEIHFSSTETNNLFIKEINKINKQQSSLENICKVYPNIEDNLDKKWKEIYRILHQIHKGNEKICHKCLNIEQHISLFGLAIFKLLQKKKESYQLSLGSVKFNVFYSLVKIILMPLTYKKPNQQVIQINKFIWKLPEYYSTRKLLLNILNSYLKCFNYIDLCQFQNLFIGNT